MQQPGTLIEGKYEILGKIREGGMGAIYKVRHRLLDEVRVVKVMQHDVVGDEEMKRRFLEEARTATRLKHPNLCTIHDFALDEEGKAYLVMEFIDGTTVADLLRRKGPPGLALSLEIAHQALLALSYLHRKSVVHRDIAPDNLMLTYDDDGRPLLKLIDLGIAKTLDKGVGMTSTGVFLGKLKYASPEQYGSLTAGQMLDGRSDIYSLGVVLYELLTGTRPFVGESPTELLRAHVFEPPIPFSKSDPDGKVPPELGEAVLKALAKSRDDRFASAEDFDREIVSLKQRFSRPDDMEDSTKILATVIPQVSPAADVTITPSAQNRLDRQFVAAATPLPTRPKLAIAPPSAGDDVRTELVGETRQLKPPFPRRLTLVVALAAAAAAAVIIVRTVGRPGESREAPPPPASAPRTAVPAGVQPASRPTAAAQPEPAAAAPAAPTAAPLPETKEEAPPPAAEPAPAAAPEETLPGRRLAESARTEASDTRRRAERAGAPRQAAAPYEAGRAREKEGQKLMARKEYTAARAAFAGAARSFANAAGTASAAPRQPAARPSPAERVASSSLPTAIAEPARPAAVPTSAPAEETSREPAHSAVPAPAEPSRREPQDTERIRDTVRRYVEAQNALDVDRYARVYPSVNRDRVQAAFESLRSQTLEFDIQKIEVAPGGTRAVVRGHEKRLVVPRVGSEQRDSRTTVIQLEKRGDAWVITGLS